MKVKSLIVALLISFFSAIAQAQTADYRTLVLLNGRIWTGDSDRPYVQAIAISPSSGTVLESGQSAQLRKLWAREPGVRFIDLKGKFVMPGINDSHIHFLGGSLTAFQVDLSEAKTLEEAQKLIKKFADDNPDVPWVTGFGWQYSIFPSGRLALREDLDSIVKDRPAYIRSYDGHSSWANSKAFEISKVDENTKFEGFGELVRAADGKPSGMMKEGAMGLVSRNIPPVTRELQLEALRRGMKRAAALGITSIQNAHGSLQELELYEELLKKGELTLRTKFAFSIGPNTTKEELHKIAELSKRYTSPMLRVGAVKIVVDGVIESYTAAMLSPYTNKPETSGKPNYTDAQLMDVVSWADKEGLQIYIHAIGDRGVQMALDAFEVATVENGKRDSRFRIEHIETIQPEDIPRFKELGVIASMEPIHADPGTVRVWSANIGPERTSRGFAWRALEMAGAKLIFSSDYPAAISMSPWRGIHNAVNRRTIEGDPKSGWLPQHRVSVRSALMAYTVNGAYASFEERKKGILQAAYYADLIVLDRNPFLIPSMDLYKINPLMTIFDGKIIYDSLTK